MGDVLSREVVKHLMHQPFGSVVLLVDWGSLHSFNKLVDRIFRLVKDACNVRIASSKMRATSGSIGPQFSHISGSA